MATPTLLFNGTDLSAYGLTLESYDMPLETGAVLETQHVPYHTGEVAYGSSYGARTISCRVFIQAETETALMNQLRALAFIFKQDLDCALVLKVPKYENVFFMARRKSTKLLNKNSTIVRLEYEFYCQDPHAYAATTTTQNVTLISTPTQFTVPRTLVANGGSNALSIPVWTLTLTNTPGTVVFENVTNSEVLSWTGSAVSGNKIRLDCSREYLERSIDSGVTWVKQMAGISTGFKFPVIHPNATNTMKITGATGTLALVWRDRWIGG